MKIKNGKPRTIIYDTYVWARICEVAAAISVSPSTLVREILMNWYRGSGGILRTQSNEQEVNIEELLNDE